MNTLTCLPVLLLFMWRACQGAAVFPDDNGFMARFANGDQPAFVEDQPDGYVEALEWMRFHLLHQFGEYVRASQARTLSRHEMAEARYALRQIRFITNTLAQLGSPRDEVFEN